MLRHLNVLTFADHPHVIEGIVLINTAGSTDPLWDPENVPEKPERSKLFVDITSWMTFAYLQGGIQKQLEKLYPIRPFNADEFLNKEIYRASCDPCAKQVCPPAELSCAPGLRRQNSPAVLLEYECML